MQSVGIFQVKMFSQWGYSSTKYAVTRDITVQNIQPVMDIPGQNIPSVGIFQYKIFSQYGYSRSKYSVTRDIPVQNIQPV
jgi:uncharacterized protein YjdB